MFNRSGDSPIGVEAKASARGLGPLPYPTASGTSAKKARPLEKEMNRLHTTAGSVSRAASALEKRLQPVMLPKMTPSVAPRDEAALAPPQTFSPVCRSIRDARILLRAVAEQLENMRRRVET